MQATIFMWARTLYHNNNIVVAAKNEGSSIFASCFGFILVK